MLAALLIVSLVFGLLLESVTGNLSDLGRARLEARASALAEARAREIALELSAGVTIENGEFEGVYEPPDEDLQWHVSVTDHTLPLPADYPLETSPSPIFALQGGAPTPLPPGQSAPLRLIEVRVFAADAELESAEPFVLLAVAPTDPARLEQLQQQGAQQPPQQPDGSVPQ